MSPKSRHNYEKRIRELEAEVEFLNRVRSILIEIYDAAIRNEKSNLNPFWVVSRLRQLLWRQV